MLVASNGIEWYENGSPRQMELMRGFRRIIEEDPVISNMVETVRDGSKELYDFVGSKIKKSASFLENPRNKLIVSTVLAGTVGMGFAFAMPYLSNTPAPADDALHQTAQDDYALSLASSMFPEVYAESSGFVGKGTKIDNIIADHHKGNKPDPNIGKEKSLIGYVSEKEMLETAIHYDQPYRYQTTIVGFLVHDGGDGGLIVYADAAKLVHESNESLNYLNLTKPGNKIDFKCVYKGNHLCEITGFENLTVLDRMHRMK